MASIKEFGVIQFRIIIVPFFNEKNKMSEKYNSVSEKKQKRILVLVEDYPNNEGGVSLMYVHTRNVHYKNSGHIVKVLSFRAKCNYVFQGIEVISPKSYSAKEEFDLLILHAANIKHHFLFLLKHSDEFKKIVFFFHGHEVLRVNSVYSTPYFYVRRNNIRYFIQNIYDSFKLLIWRKYLPAIAYKSWFVFVSKWMQNEFFRWTKIPESNIADRCSIIYNGVGQLFEKGTFNDTVAKNYDFITIRSFLDGSKYAVDLVNEWAKNTPDCKFLIIGKGRIFEFYDKADNITWINKSLNHQEIIEQLNTARFALMPTRTDAQGLMMCEMAAFGIPVITSDIPVCHEVFDGFDNAFFVPNEKDVSLDSFRNKKSVSNKDCRFYTSNTIGEELNLFNRITAERVV